MSNKTTAIRKIEDTYAQMVQVVSIMDTIHDSLTCGNNDPECCADAIAGARNYLSSLVADIESAISEYCKAN